MLKVISPFGPKIAKLKFSKQLINKINREVDKINLNKSLTRKLDYSKKLVGQVKQEISLPKSFIKKKPLPGLFKQIFFLVNLSPTCISSDEHTDAKANFIVDFSGNLRLRGEKSYLFDFGAFGAVREAYYPADDIDKSGAGLGFFGLGIRDNYDTNYFFTGNIVPFHTGGTYPIDDKTARFDFGASKRKDNETQMVRVGVEKGKSSVGSLVSGGCRGDDDQDTQKIEIGLSKVGKHESGFDYLLALEGGVKRGEMTYTAVHPTSGNCTDLTSMGNYSTRTDNVQSVESDYVASAMIKQNIYGGKGTIKVRLGNYQHDFDQHLILDNVVDLI